MANVDKTNVHKIIDEAIDKYFKSGMIVDALFWSKCIGLLRDEIKQAKNESGS